MCYRPSARDASQAAWIQKGKPLSPQILVVAIASALPAWLSYRRTLHQTAHHPSNVNQNSLHRQILSGKKCDLASREKIWNKKWKQIKRKKQIVAVIYHARWSVSNHRPTKTNTHMKKFCLHDTRGCHLVNYLAIAKLNSFFVIPCFPWKLRGRGQSFAFDVSKFSFSANLVGCLCSFNSDKHLQRNCYIHLPCFINPSSPVTRWSFISQHDILHECRWCVLEFVMFVV